MKVGSMSPAHLLYGRSVMWVAFGNDLVLTGSQPILEEEQTTENEKYIALYAMNTEL